MTKTQFAIRQTDGQFVSGYNAQHMIVQRTSDARYIKKFSSAARAVAFVNRYSAGYGLIRESVEIVSVQS